MQSHGFTRARQLLESTGCQPVSLGSLPRRVSPARFETVRVKVLPAGLPATTGWQPVLPRRPVKPCALFETYGVWGERFASIQLSASFNFARAVPSSGSL